MSGFPGNEISNEIANDMDMLYQFKQRCKQMNYEDKKENKFTVVKAPLIEDVKNLVWKRFKRDLEEKHGVSGAKGKLYEEKAIDLIRQYNILNAKGVIDYGEDPVRQRQGVDFDIISNDGSIHSTQVKGGWTAISYDKSIRSFNVTVPKDFMDYKYTNHYVMNVSFKGDHYVLYDKNEMNQWLIYNKESYIISTYGYDINIGKLPDFVKTSFKVYK
jgi:hypothetical protein